MKSANLPEMNEKELLQEEKKQKSILKVLRVSIGFMIVASIYNTFYNGFKISTITPLCFVPIFMSIEKRYKDVQKEIQSRKLQ
jgi:hypothetical protein